MKLSKKLLLFGGILAILSSCSQDEELKIKEEKPTVGRFDNTPFVWDEVYSLRPSSQIFIGDIAADDLFNPDTSTKLRTSSSNGRQSGGRYSSKGGDDAISSGGYNENNIKITNPNGIYVGSAFPSSTFGLTFDKEITEPRNPIDLIFDFKDPYIDEVQKESGSIGYKLALKRAIKSEEYASNLKTNKASVEYFMTSYSSSTDIQKAISGSAKFASIFAAKVQANASSKNIKIDGKLVARMTASNFNVYMDTPTKSKGFFKDANLNSSNNVYLRSLTYGKVVYMAIESSFSYSEIKRAFQTSFSLGFLSSKIKGNEDITKVFNSSIVTIFVIDDNSNGYSFYDIDKIGEINNLLFSTNFNNLSYGFPIYCEGRYISDNSIFKLISSSSGRNSGSSSSGRNSGSSSSGSDSGRSSGSGR